MYLLKTPILENYVKGTSPRLFVVHALGNAIDAHIEAGRRLEEIEVIHNNKVMVIKDKGKGISPETIGRVFSNMFYTTREDLRRYVGRYGLGLKIMASIKGGYMLRTYYEGWLYTYRVIITTDGGVACRLERKEEKEGVGTEVEAAVSEVNINEVSWLWRKEEDKIYEGELGYGKYSSGLEIHTDKGLVYQVPKLIMGENLETLPIGLVLKLPHHGLHYGIQQDGIKGIQRNHLVLKTYFFKLSQEIKQKKQEEIDQCESIYEVFRERMTWDPRANPVLWRGEAYYSRIWGVKAYSIRAGITKVNEIDMWIDPKPIYIGNNPREDLGNCYFIPYSEWHSLSWRQSQLKPYVTFVEPELIQEKKKRKARTVRHFYGKGIMDSAMKPYPINLKEGENRLYTKQDCLYKIYRWMGVECVYTEKGEPGEGWLNGEGELGKYISEEEIEKLLNYDDIRISLESFGYDYLYRDVPLYGIVKYHLRGKGGLVALLRNYKDRPEGCNRYLERVYPLLEKRLRIAGQLISRVTPKYQDYLDLEGLWERLDFVPEGQLTLYPYAW